MSRSLFERKEGRCCILLSVQCRRPVFPESSRGRMDSPITTRGIVPTFVHFKTTGATYEVIQACGLSINPSSDRVLRWHGQSISVHPLAQEQVPRPFQVAVWVLLEGGNKKRPSGTTRGSLCFASLIENAGFQRPSIRCQLHYFYLPYASQRYPHAIPPVSCIPAQICGNKRRRHTGHGIQT